MPRYVALLRGVSPLNAKMPELKRCFEGAGFAAVRTVLGSGNVAFDARTAKPASLERKAEMAMAATLGRSFQTIVRSSEYLAQLIESDPFAAFKLHAGSKRVVTFLRSESEAAFALPPERDGARILALRGRELFSAYVPGPRGPVFMTVIERAFGTELTTRTWDTVRKCAAA